MFFLDTVTIPKIENATLIITKKKAYLHQLNDENISIIEHKIQIVHSDSKKDEEIAVIIDEFIIDCLDIYYSVKIDSQNITFDDKVVYEYEQGTITELETRKESLVFSMSIPEKIILEDEIQVKISVSNDGYFIIDDDCGKIIKIKILNFFKKNKFNFLKFNSSFLKDFFNENPKKFCKVFTSDEFPLCFETFDKRTFISPII